MTETKTAYCSWCYEKTSHRLIKKENFKRNTYICSLCKNETLVCRFCNNMAKGKPNNTILKVIEKESKFSKLAQSWDNELCAEHDGTIASFPNLSMKLDDIAEYQKIFEREKFNLMKASKYTGYGVAGMVSIAGVAVTSGAGAAPIAAALGNMGLLGTASTGVAINSLSGAALTSASLAAIGGSVAAGTSIVSAAGLALGGVMGGVIANKYHGDDKSFAISLLRKRDEDKKVVFINGFTQENEVDFYDWQCAQLAFDPSQTMYSLNWASKTNLKLGEAFAMGVGNQAAKRILLQLGKAGGKNAAKKLNPLGYVAMLGDLIGNPWHEAMVRAAQSGVQLADAISRTEGQKFRLVGHSLGCRVIYYALEALSSKSKKYISDVILLGGAVGKDDKSGWQKASSAVDGCIYNCHSVHDKVLSVIYRTANAGLSNPIGINPITFESEKIKNINCDGIVHSHMTWKKHYEEILDIIYG
ncbi:DUF726 domain-containing protein [Parashewanella spongiae]|uniref:DUF726 domain-containing protein n=1 Tax=Parashewanella spongiae TaxID=342950 RepID=A0A3A6TJC0_9GAMM|nr:DUF726 domain-containing protein [Parashewanella spongiae]MCL1078707.1 TMCO4 family protein [Parashewanella spongiae]RJY12278.1 DUF726 domain-containing protein [Parashewanella spongiae]